MKTLLLILFCLCFVSDVSAQKKTPLSQPTPDMPSFEDFMARMKEKERPRSESAQGLSDEQKSLRGLSGVNLIVEEIKPALEKYGLSRDRIRTETELRLRRAGITVFPRISVSQGGDFYYLYVNVQVMDAGDGSYVFNVEVEFIQEGLLSRFASNKYPTLPQQMVSTWSNSTLGIAGREKLSSIKDAVTDLVDQFANDYLAANPK